MALSIKVPIFADTNLGTHIALDVNPTVKSDDLKRELEEAHLICFPKLGKIKINALEVKRKSHFYRLPNSLCIKHVFQGFKGTWFIHIEACFVPEIPKPAFYPNVTTLSAEPKSLVPSSNLNNVNYKTEKMGTKRILCPKARPSSIGIEKCHVSRIKDGCTKGEVGEANKLDAISENHSEVISEAVSVSVIIKKYFCDNKNHDLNCEVTSRVDQGRSKASVNDCSTQNINEACRFIPQTPARKSNLGLAKKSRGKIRKNQCESGEVGKRILVASNELGSRKSLVGLYRCKGENSSLVKSLVFEMSDGDD